MYKQTADDRSDRFRPSIEQYSEYHRQGYITVSGLVTPDEVEEIKRHATDIFFGKAAVPGLEPPHPNANLKDLVQRFTRIHMLHRSDAVSEKFMLHPRILDVLEALIGPDVLALQTMLFFNPPGLGGQGWHQDSYYITTYPDTLIGAWLAIDPADEENGCVWVLPHSHHEPVYPDPERGSLIHSEGVFSNLTCVSNTSHMDDDINDLGKIARKYPPPIPAALEPGDVLFFNGHILHRSYPNRSESRWRRAFVSHYCNARSWVPWNHGPTAEGQGANQFHILARGATHLPFAKPAFGTPCAASESYSHLASEGVKEIAAGWSPESHWSS